MRTLVIGLLVSWSCGGGKPEPRPISNQQEGRNIAVTDPEPIVGDRQKAEASAARLQAVEQARAAGILGKTAESTPAPGQLDQRAIRNGIRSHRRSIVLCYEARLSQDDTLQGTTTVQFAIGPDGSVASSVGSGFDAQVDACVADVIKRIIFPAPAGGGTVQVSYPFAFKSADP